MQQGLAGQVLSSELFGPTLRLLQHPGANQEMMTGQIGNELEVSDISQSIINITETWEDGPTKEISE